MNLPILMDSSFDEFVNFGEYANFAVSVRIYITWNPEIHSGRQKSKNPQTPTSWAKTEFQKSKTIHPVNPHH